VRPGDDVGAGLGRGMTARVGLGRVAGLGADHGGVAEERRAVADGGELL
jgi:hypothetical protein